MLMFIMVTNFNWVQCTTVDFSDVDNIMTLQSRSGVTQGHWKLPFESLGTVSYSYSIVTETLSCIISEIIKRNIGGTSRLFHSQLTSSLA